MRIFCKNNKWNILQGILGTAEKFLLIFLIYQISALTDAAVEGNASAFTRKMPLLILTLVLEILFFYAFKAVVIQIRVFCACDLRGRIYRRILFEDVRSGEKKEKADNILNIYNSQIEQLAVLAPQSGEMGVAVLTLLISASYMAAVNLKLLIISVIFIPLSGYLYKRLMVPMQQKYRDIMNEKKAVNQIVKENLDGFYIVRAFALSDLFLGRFKERSENIRKAETDVDGIAAVLDRVGILLRYLPQLIIPLYGGYLAYIGEMSVGELLAANTVIAYVFGPIEKIIAIRKKRKELKPVMDNLSELLQDETKDTIIHDIKWEPGSVQVIELEDLDFGYADGSKVLRQLELCIHKGEHILLMGESGIGKSTLAKILCGLETEYTGKVRINGREILKEDMGNIRKNVAYVPQNAYIFAGSIKNNICMGHEVTPEQLKRAEELSGVTQFTEKFPKGHDTMVGEGGVQLSGGQRKRIAAARAMIADKDLYILDEPTASLDEQGGIQLMKNFAEFCADKAMLVISHNTKDMPHMDTVYTMREGRLHHG